MDEFTDLEILRDHLIKKDGLILNKIKDGVKYQITINVNDIPFEETNYFEKSVIGLYSLLYNQCYPSTSPFPLIDSVVNVVVLHDNTFYLRGVSINILEMNDKEDIEFEEWIMLKKPDVELNHIKTFTEFI